MDSETKKNLKVAFKKELSELKNMGFVHVEQCLTGLQKCNGDLNRAVDWILFNPFEGEDPDIEEIEEIKVVPKIVEKKSSDNSTEEFEEKWYKMKCDPKNAPSARSHHCSVEHNGCMYVFGGDNSTGEDDIMYRLDLGTKQWNKIQTKGGLARVDATAVVYRGKIYCYGGKVQKTHSKNFSVFDFDTNTWTNLPNGEVPELEGHSVAVDGDKMYLYGGFKSTGTASSVLYQYCFESEKWSVVTVKTQVLPALGRGQMTVINKLLFICGGVNDQGSTNVDIYMVDLFSLVGSKITLKDTVPRSKFSLVKTDEDNVLLIGGFSTHKHEDAWTFRIEQRQWDACYYEDLPQVEGHSTVKLKNTIYVFGGCQSNEVFFCRLPASGLFGLMMNPTYSDITLSVGNIKIPAHKSFLTQAKAWFNSIKPETTTLDLTKYSPQYVIKILKYMYGSPLMCTGTDIFNIITIAREIQFEELEIHCIHQLSDLSPMGVLDLLEKTEEYLRVNKKVRMDPTDNLKKLCFDFYQKNKTLFDTKEAHDRLMKLDKDLYIEMIVLPEFDEGGGSLIPDDGAREEQIRIHFFNLRKLGMFTDFKIVSGNYKEDLHRVLFYEANHVNNQFIQGAKEIKFDVADSDAVQVWTRSIYSPLSEVSDNNQKLLDAFARKVDIGIDENAKFNTVKFTCLGATGQDGPVSTKGYDGTPLKGAVTLKKGIQVWKVPKTRNYKITAAGACGGIGDRLKTGGRGAIVSGIYRLTAGTVLWILVGQKGGNGPSNSNSAGGGGGGTFIVVDNKTPIMVAGGGNGDSWKSWQTDAVDAKNVGKNDTPPIPSKTTGGSPDRGGGGGSFAENGKDKSGTTNTGGSSYLNGGKGGNQYVQGCHGGFGGGGGAEYEGGGGGGYCGGTVVACNQYNVSYPQNGSTSYCTGLKPTAVGFNSDDGYVLIE
jgi:hypothetical protein